MNWWSYLIEFLMKTYLTLPIILIQFSFISNFLKCIKNSSWLWFQILTNILMKNHILALPGNHNYSKIYLGIPANSTITSQTWWEIFCFQSLLLENASIVRKKWAHKSVFFLSFFKNQFLEIKIPIFGMASKSPDMVLCVPWENFIISPRALMSHF